MHHLPLLLFTMTTFANQAEYSTSLMKFAASSFSTSSFNTFFLLSLNFLLYWVTFAFRFRKSLCAIKLGSIPSILVPSKRKHLCWASGIWSILPPCLVVMTIWSYFFARGCQLGFPSSRLLAGGVIPHVHIEGLSLRSWLINFFQSISFAPSYL